MITINLQSEAIVLHAILADAVQKYSAKHNAPRTAKKHPAVTRIDLVFSLADGDSAPWVNLHFDTKPGSEPDGSPTHPDFAKLTRKAWLPAVNAVWDGEKVAIVKLDGKARKCGGGQLTEMIGNFLVNVLLDARSNGVFAGLPKGQRCELGVEDPTTGDFGWPAYEDRGKRNLV